MVAWYWTHPISFRSGKAENWLLLCTALLRVYVHQPGLWFKVTESELSSVTHRHCGLHNRRSKLTRNISSFKDNKYVRKSSEGKWYADALVLNCACNTHNGANYFTRIIILHPYFSFHFSPIFIRRAVVNLKFKKYFSSFIHSSLTFGSRPCFSRLNNISFIVCWLLKSNFKRTLSDVSNIFLNIKMLFIRQERNVKI